MSLSSEAFEEAGDISPLAVILDYPKEKGGGFIVLLLGKEPPLPCFYNIKGMTVDWQNRKYPLWVAHLRMRKGTQQLSKVTTFCKEVLTLKQYLEKYWAEGRQRKKFKEAEGCPKHF